MGGGKISVLLAAYNGGRFIGEQISSILSELTDGDELIVSDDGSSDDTLKIVREFNDARIKIVQGPKRGFVRNFENAFAYSRNEFIFFSDQDDVWVKGKRERTLKAFTDGVNVVKHDAVIVDENLNALNESYNALRGANVSYGKNFIKNTFTGCCMAARRAWLEKILPVPENIYHDRWIGILACKFGCAKVIDDKLLLYRRHGANVSAMKRKSLFKILKERIYLYKQIKKYIKRTKKACSRC